MPFEARGVATPWSQESQFDVGWGRIQDLRGNKPAGTPSVANRPTLNSFADNGVTI